MDSYTQAVTQIIKAQEAIIGPLAYNQAISIQGIRLNSNNEVLLSGNGKEILDNLVKKYSEFFGKASIEVCKEAILYVKPTPRPEDLPDILR